MKSFLPFFHLSLNFNKFNVIVYQRFVEVEKMFWRFQIKCKSSHQMFFCFGEDLICLKSSIINRTKQNRKRENAHAHISLWNCHWSWLAAAKLMAARNNDWLQQTVFVSIALRLWRRSLYYPFQTCWNKRRITRSENISLIVNFLFQYKLARRSRLVLFNRIWLVSY